MAKEVEINGYSLSRAWFDFSFENQGKVTGNHGCMFMWFLELNNRMGWVKEFGAPREQTMVAVGISSYNTYKKVFNDLVEWGFVKVVKESKNQWTANIIALSNFNNTQYKALDKALIQASECPIKICESNIEGTDTSTIQGTDTGTVAINKPVNNETSKPINNIPLTAVINDFKNDWEQYDPEDFETPKKDLLNDKVFISDLIEAYSSHGINEHDLIRLINIFFTQIKIKREPKTNLKGYRSYCTNWLKIELDKLISKTLKFSNQITDVESAPLHQGLEKEKVGKWLWNNNGWRDTTLFTKEQKKKHGLA